MCMLLPLKFSSWGAIHEHLSNHWQLALSFSWLPYHGNSQWTVLHSQCKMLWRMSLYLSVNDKELSVMTSFMKCTPRIEYFCNLFKAHYIHWTNRYIRTPNVFRNVKVHETMVTPEKWLKSLLSEGNVLHCSYLFELFKFFSDNVSSGSQCDYYRLLISRPQNNVFAASAQTERLLKLYIRLNSEIRVKDTIYKNIQRDYISKGHTRTWIFCFLPRISVTDGPNSKLKQIKSFCNLVQ